MKTRLGLFFLTLLATLLLMLSAAPTFTEESRKECRDRCEERHDTYLETCLDSDQEQATRSRCRYMADQIQKQ